MKIYTRTGDGGTTALANGTRTSKDDARVEAYGTVDELQACLGLLPASPQLLIIQRQLFRLGGILAGLEGEAPGTEGLEQEIDRLTASMPPRHCFIIPGGTGAAAQAHVCRTVCRRAERRAITAEAPAGVVAYLNRLSDYLFTLACYINYKAGVVEEKA